MIPLDIYVHGFSPFVGAIISLQNMFLLPAFITRFFRIQVGAGLLENGGMVYIPAMESSSWPMIGNMKANGRMVRSMAREP